MNSLDINFQEVKNNSEAQYVNKFYETKKVIFMINYYVKHSTCPQQASTATCPCEFFCCLTVLCCISSFISFSQSHQLEHLNKMEEKESPEIIIDFYIVIFTRYFLKQRMIYGFINVQHSQVDYGVFTEKQGLINCVLQASHVAVTGHPEIV